MAFSPTLHFGILGESVKLGENAVLGLSKPELVLFADLKILKLGDIYQLHISSFAFECLHDIAPAQFKDFFRPISSIHSYNTRGATRGDFFLVRKNTLQYGIRSISYNGVRIWNNIPSEIRNSTSVTSFRKKFKNSLLESYMI